VRLWRISNYADLSGEGGRRRSGRWHSSGRPVVYLAEHPALALLEDLVHLEGDVDDLPDTYQLLEIDVPGDIAISTVDAAHLDETDAEWRRDLAATRALGDDWLRAGHTALVRVPSVILPKSTNVLLNPAHADTHRVKVAEVTRPAYDRRLFGPARAAVR
jgi:RES domain-containing protein